MKKIIIAFSLLASSCAHTNLIPQGHTCQWDLCPFKGVTAFSPAVSECEQGSDCYILDSLHLVYPTFDYDALDSMLFSPMRLSPGEIIIDTVSDGPDRISVRTNKFAYDYLTRKEFNQLIKK